MTERRMQPRLADSDLVMLTWQESSVELKQLGNVADVSLDGLGIIVDQLIPAGTAVQVSYGDGNLLGVVKHHLIAGDAYCLGIQFTAASKDSTLHFQPELLIHPS